MFRPRHAYRSPITNRYRGKAKGCPVFNNLVDINSNMVEQHDECLECLAKIKKRPDLYRTLVDNNKPSNNVIKSLQKLSSSASNNRLKTCLQFLIIKVNEKSISTPKLNTAATSITTSSRSSSPKLGEITKEIATTRQAEQSIVVSAGVKNQAKRQKLHNQQHKQRQQHKHKHNLLASPPQDQVSSTQDQVGPSQDDHDCQTSPMTLTTTQTDDFHSPQMHEITKSSPSNEKSPQDSPTIKHEDQNGDSPAQTRSSPALNFLLKQETATTTTTSSSSITRSNNNISNRNNGSKTNISPSQTVIIDGATIINSNSNSLKGNVNGDCSQHKHTATAKRRRIHNSSDHDTSSTASWSSSYASPPSPISTSSISSSSSQSSSLSSCSSSLSPSPSPLSSPDMVNELKGPRLKLSEEKIRKIKRRPILFDDYLTEHSFASTPTTSSGCSPGQHSTTTQNSDQSRLGVPANNTVIHMFQAPPKFVNNLKPCNLPATLQEPSLSITPPAPAKTEMLNCAICGIKERPPNISKIYGQNSCLLCTRFFATFLKRPQQLYCAQDGDCLMTFDSRCQACWIKICLQKFDIEEEHRKTGQKYSPKLLSSPNVSLITIDTSISR